MPVDIGRKIVDDPLGEALDKIGVNDSIGRYK
jgi:hypothetical protein